MTQPKTPTNAMVPVALWATAGLTVIAIPLVLFFGLLLLSNGIPQGASPVMLILPFGCLGACLLHWEVLARANDPDSTQYGRLSLTCIAVAGCAAWATFIYPALFQRHGSPGNLLLPPLIGIFSNGVVWSLLWQACRPAQPVSPAAQPHRPTHAALQPDHPRPCLPRTRG